MGNIDIQYKFPEPLEKNSLDELLILAVRNKTTMTEAIKKNCPNQKKHTKSPNGYLAWHFWAEEKSKKYKSTKCPDCGLYCIWIKKPKDGE